MGVARASGRRDVCSYEKCIFCYKCVEACGTDFQVHCGNCVAACPTGALVFKSEYGKRTEGTWDESKQKATNTMRPYCGVGCTLTLHVQDNEIVKVTSPFVQTVTRGNLCIKGRFGWKFVQNRKRDDMPA